LLAVPLSLALALAASPNKTLVAPFDNLSPQGTQGWIGESIAETLTAHFRLAGQEVVSSAERRQSLREKGVDPDEPSTLAMLTEVAVELDSERIILGSFRSEEDELEVVARIVDVASGRTVGFVDDHGKVDDLARIENQLAKNILRLEGRPVPADFPQAAARREAVSFEAYEAFIKAKQSDSPSEARKLLEEAFATDPTFADAALLLGQVLLDESEAEEAVEVLRAIPPEDPVYREAYFTLGVAYLALDQTRLATEIFEHLAEQQPVASFANNLGVAFLRRGEIENAVVAFREAVELDPSAVYTFNLGWAAWRAERHHEARHWLGEAARLEPENAEAHLLLSVLASLGGEVEEADREQQAAVSIAPELAEVEVSSLDGLEHVVDRLPVQLTTYRFPVAPANEESAPSSSDLSEDASELGPSDFETTRDEDLAESRQHLDKARELRAASDLTGAVEELERAVYLDPYSVEIRTELSEVFVEMGELDKAAGELQVALWNREESGTLVRLAELYESMGELDKARAHAERATELDGDDAGARALLERLTVQPQLP